MGTTNAGTIGWRQLTLRVSGHLTRPERFLFHPEKIDIHPWVQIGLTCSPFFRTKLNMISEVIQWSEKLG
jgi:hypothetical protein